MASVPASAPAAIGAEAPEKLSNIVQMSEFAHIRETLKACGGSRIETARKLGISERTLRYRLAKAREQGDDIARVANGGGQRSRARWRRTRRSCFSTSPSRASIHCRSRSEEQTSELQ